MWTLRYFLPNPDQQSPGGWCDNGATVGDLSGSRADQVVATAESHGWIMSKYGKKVIWRSVKARSAQKCGVPSGMTRTSKRSGGTNIRLVSSKRRLSCLGTHHIRRNLGPLADGPSFCRGGLARSAIPAAAISKPLRFRSGPILLL
jgi:hypothetical protein